MILIQQTRKERMTKGDAKKESSDVFSMALSSLLRMCVNLPSQVKGGDVR